MTDRRTDHAAYEIKRTHDGAPDRIFAAWAEPAAKLLDRLGNSLPADVPQP